jgi:hypothetical protein
VRRQGERAPVAPRVPNARRAALDRRGGGDGPEQRRAGRHAGAA